MTVSTPYALNSRAAPATGGRGMRHFIHRGGRTKAMKEQTHSATPVTAKTMRPPSMTDLLPMRHPPARLQEVRRAYVRRCSDFDGSRFVWLVLAVVVRGLSFSHQDPVITSPRRATSTMRRRVLIVDVSTDAHLVPPFLAASRQWPNLGQDMQRRRPGISSVFKTRPPCIR